MMSDEHHSQPPTPPDSKSPAPPSILPEFVLLPGVFDKELLEGNKELQRALKDLLLGLCENGLLSSVPNRAMRKAIVKRIMGLPNGSFRKDIEVAYRRLADWNRLVRRPQQIDKLEDNPEWWLGRIEDSDVQLPFGCITLEREPASDVQKADKRYSALANICDSSVFNDCRRRKSESVQSSEHDYRRVLDPLLRFAREVDIVDPYLKPEKIETSRFMDIVSQLHFQKSFDGKKGTIRIHSTLIVTKKKINRQLVDVATYDLEEVLGLWERLLMQFHKTYKHKYEVFIWGESEGNAPHNRRILTNQHCGIETDKSFRVVSNPPKADNNWKIMDHESWQLEKSKYDGDSTFFKLEGMCKVPSRKPNYS